MKTYRRHNCTRSHRDVRTLAKCMFRRAAWITGSGPYALLAWCDVLTVTLHATPEDAQPFLDQIDDTGCGHACTGPSRARPPRPRPQTGDPT